VLLAGETKRARTYAQQLERVWQLDRNVEILGVFYGQTLRTCPESLLNDETGEYFDKENIFIPDLNEPIEKTFDRNGWIYHKIISDDVNSEELLTLLEYLSVDVVVYAGYGGQILKGKHFNGKRKYLHMHPGSLPDERGSTTLFYSILKGHNCTVTSFWMTEKIDDGEILYQEEYVVPNKGVDLDGWFDHVIRGDCFFKTMKRYLSGELSSFKVDTSKSEEYYIIHPVLKHVALMGLT